MRVHFQAKTISVVAADSNRLGLQDLRGRDGAAVSVTLQYDTSSGFSHVDAVAGTRSRT